MARKIICWLLLVTLLTSCDDDSIVNLPKNAPRLVVNCIGQNDKVWQCRLTSSKDILGYLPFEPVPTASINLYENGVLKGPLTRLNEFDLDLYGTDDFSPVPGNSYQLEVSSDGFTSVSASYLHPVGVTLNSLEIRFLGQSTSSENGTDIQAKISFVDPVGENFYGVLLKQKSEDASIPTAAAILGLDFIDPAYNENKQIFASTIIFSDAFFEGREASLEFSSTITKYPGDPELEYYTAYLLTLSKEYYEYLKTHSLQEATKNDPFAQPVMVESNIENGFGIFGGFTQEEITVHAVK